jgi:hypothetical protein
MVYGRKINTHLATMSIYVMSVMGDVTSDVIR